ncbi:MCE family protein [Mycobacterium vicinigordonae]|uniref:MCE family protein n=1 Tax=Mycobacterium vicinigordonae TaxID=1719132 RepID=A0A7D6DW20_9MYCO|nr:MlaD family protein [Mycobacterium vicinigordonae]QLL06144.1 MCE family protein [Mycobacterium vicinigordonae]
MNLDRRTRIQLALFALIAVASGAVMCFRYIDAPAMLFGSEHYTVTLKLARAGGLYYHGNVVYRGTEVGRIESVRLTANGVDAVLTLKSEFAIPSDLQARVHSTSAIGEQYVELLPRTGNAPPLKNGDVILAQDTSIPPDIDTVLDATNRGLAAIPQQNLKTVIDESYISVGGLGPELSRLVTGSTELAIDAEKNLDSLTMLIDQTKPILDSQTDSANAIQGWAAHLATITGELRSSDTSVAGVLHNGGTAADEARQLFRRLQPTLPLLLANLVGIGEVAVAYQPALEQLLVLFPQAVANLQAAIIANLNTKQAYRGIFLDFNLNFGLPPVCNTGFLPPQQQRAASLQDYPERAPGDLYCRVPQDSPFNVRGARNYPCLTVPDKRAPTAKMCDSDENYVPLNDGYNWKGDPNGTLTGQDVPQLPPGQMPPANAVTPGSLAPPAGAPPPPLATAEYDPATGNYVGPDGHLYNQSNLSQTAPKERTWQSMLLPPPTS